MYYEETRIYLSDIPKIYTTNSLWKNTAGIETQDKDEPKFLLIPKSHPWLGSLINLPLTLNLKIILQFIIYLFVSRLSGLVTKDEGIVLSCPNVK
jgi:hypothetical protein